MNFWTFCENIQVYVGLKKTLLHINIIYDLFCKYFTVEQVVEAINQTSRNPKNDPQS